VNSGREPSQTKDKKPNMKSNLKRLTIILIAAGMGMVEVANAFYDPGLQRWINRDPLNDGGSLVYGVVLPDSAGFQIEQSEMLFSSALASELPNEIRADLGISVLNGEVQLEAVEGPNLHQFIGNMPIARWDAFGLSKGGKQNIGCEGFTKQSDPKLVKEALDAAKAAKQAERARKLAGLLKVIKRGGTMLTLWIDYYIILINNIMDDGSGGNCMAYNDTRDDMTSDGISTEDWEVVQDYAAKIANAACADDHASSDELTGKLLRYLECLEVKCGKRASILATRADYESDLRQQVSLLEQAHEMARQSEDRANLTFTASSLAQLYIEESVDIPAAQKWLALLADALGNKWDDLEYQEFRELTDQVEKLKQQTKPDTLA